MPDGHIVWMSESRGADPSVGGGKFANLSKLRSSGVRVPMGFAVSTSAFRVMAENLKGQIEPLLKALDTNDVGAIEATSDRITQVIKGSRLPEELEAGIKGAYRELGRGWEAHSGDVPVAVRSSATAEDLAEASLAGQHETYLWVRGGDDVLRYVRECWASLFSARSLKYRHVHHLDSFEVDMGVVVQRMVASSSSGVMFTLNPANGDVSKITIESSWGLGEAIVGGLVTPDSFTVDKVTLEILGRRMNRKLREVVPLGNRAEEVDVPPERQEVLSLTDEEVVEVAKCGKSIEAMYGAPQDIEWAIDGSVESPDNVFILQARPETVWAGKERGSLSKSGGTIDMIVDKLIRGQKVDG